MNLASVTTRHFIKAARTTEIPYDRNVSSSASLCPGGKFLYKWQKKKQCDLVFLQKFTVKATKIDTLLREFVPLEGILYVNSLLPNHSGRAKCEAIVQTYFALLRQLAPYLGSLLGVFRAEISSYCCGIKSLFRKFVQNLFFSSASKYLSNRTVC